MRERLSDTAIFFHKESWWLLALYVLVRIISFFLASHEIAQAALIFALLMALGIAYFKNSNYAWMIVLGELFLGGSGHFLEFFGLSVRACLLFTFLLLWISFTLGTHERRSRLRSPHRLFLSFIPVFLFGLFALWQGLRQGHDSVAVMQDFAPFVFLLLLVPSYHVFSDERIRHFFIRAAIAALIGAAVFALLIFIASVTGTVQTGGGFHAWLTNAAQGTITQVSPWFYRVALPEHLLILPMILIILSLLMRDERHHKMWRVLLTAGLLVLALDMSWSYLLGLAAGIIMLLYKHRPMQWLKESGSAAGIFVILLAGTYFAASAGQSAGWTTTRHMFGAQAAGQDALTAGLAPVEPIFALIRNHPLIGNGLGASISYYSPVTLGIETTSSLNWGYLEMWAELGIIGSLFMLVTVAWIIFELIQKIRSVPDYHDFKVGLLASIVAMMVVNITAPALFHVISIFMLSFMLAFITRPLDIFDQCVTTIYCIFNKANQHQD